MEGVLIFGLLFLWLVLWVMLIRHERRRGAKGLPRHGALRLAFGAAALLTIMFIAGSALLLISAHGAVVQKIGWAVIRVCVLTPFFVALLVAWITLRRAPPSK